MYQNVQCVTDLLSSAGMCHNSNKHKINFHVHNTSSKNNLIFLFSKENRYKMSQKQRQGRTIMLMSPQIAALSHRNTELHINWCGSIYQKYFFLILIDELDHRNGVTDKFVSPWLFLYFFAEAIIIGHYTTMDTSIRHALFCEHMQ